jgi:hypothetical protein
VQHLGTASNRKRWNFSIFFWQRRPDCESCWDKMLELDISPDHLSGFDLGEYERLFERC